MMAKPMKTLELHYPMIQFLINNMAARERIEPMREVLSTQEDNRSVYMGMRVKHFESFVLFS